MGLEVDLLCGKLVKQIHIQLELKSGITGDLRSQSFHNNSTTAVSKLSSITHENIHIKSGDHSGSFI